MIDIKFSKTQLRLVLTMIMVMLSTIANAGGPEQTAAANPSSPPNLFYCPPISAVVKDPETRTWSAFEKWKSYDLSFVDKITQFSGAQWKGTNIGQIICIYRGEESTSFPILLAYSVLTYLPQGGRWGEDLGGYKNCISTTQEDCPFSIRVKPPEEDLYQQAEKLRKPPGKSARPGF